jgi:YD repeat-containing protein
MTKNSNKSVNWLVEEFTSVDLIAAIKSSNIKSSETFTTIEAGPQTIEYLSSSTENDVEGRPLNTKHFNEEGGIEEEYKYSYEGNFQRVELYVRGRLNCYWLNEYDQDLKLLRSEYVDAEEDSHDVETFEYDANGRLTKITDHNSAQDVEEEEPPTFLIFEWDGDQLKSMLEVYGDEEEFRMDFDYNENGQLTAVRKYIYLIDDDNKEMQELVDEQKASYNEEGQLVQNTVQYYASGAKLVISYEYDEEGNAVRTFHDDYEGEKLVRSIEFQEDGKGNLLKSVESFKPNGVVKTDIFKYTYF